MLLNPCQGDKHTERFPPSIPPQRFFTQLVRPGRPASSGTVIRNKGWVSVGWDPLSVNTEQRSTGSLGSVRKRKVGNRFWIDILLLLCLQTFSFEHSVQECKEQWEGQ